VRGWGGGLDRVNTQLVRVRSGVAVRTEMPVVALYIRSSRPCGAAVAASKTFEGTQAARGAAAAADEEWADEQKPRLQPSSPPTTLIHRGYFNTLFHSSLRSLSLPALLAKQSISLHTAASGLNRYEELVSECGNNRTGVVLSARSSIAHSARAAAPAAAVAAFATAAAPPNADSVLSWQLRPKQ